MIIESNMRTMNYIHPNSLYAFNEHLPTTLRHTIEDYASSRKQDFVESCNNLFQFATVPTNENSIRSFILLKVCLKEISYHGIYAWSTELPAVLLHQFTTFLTYLKRCHLEVWEL